MRRRAKVDDNHAEVVEALRAMGWGVKSLAQLGKGMPDLVAVRHGRVVFVEVKDGSKVPSARKRTPDEIECHEWFASHGVDVLLVEKVDDLWQLDRDARAVHEGVPARNMYE